MAIATTAIAAECWYSFNREVTPPSRDALVEVTPFVLLCESLLSKKSVLFLNELSRPLLLLIEK